MSVESASPQTVWVKRQYQTKAVVTPAFKTFLKRELEEMVIHYAQKENDLKKRLKQVSPDSPDYAQLVKEQEEAQRFIQAEDRQRAMIDGLELNSLYDQGPVEGIVEVGIGDDLYKKLGCVQLILEDGCVKEIKTVSSQFTLATA